LFKRETPVPAGVNAVNGLHSEGAQQTNAQLKESTMKNHKQHRSVPLNRIPITGKMKHSILATRRDTILEHDAVYQENMRPLIRRAQQRKISPHEFTHLQQWLASSALRRAHVPISESRQLLSA
jgi:hypothetical protein